MQPKSTIKFPQCAISPESYRDAIKVPDYAIPWHKRGFQSAVPTATERIVISDLVLNNLHGRRISHLVWSTSVNHAGCTIKIYRNGNVYDDTLGLLKLGASIYCTQIPLVAIFGANEQIDIAFLNESGANKDYSAYAIGWDF